MTVVVKGLDGFIRHVGAAAAEAKKLDTTIVSGIALEAKATVLAVAAAEVPGRKMHRFANGRGITLNARFAVKSGETATAILLPTPPGPWYLLNHGGRAHQIGGKRGNRAGFLGNAALGFAATGPISHPAFQARHTWDKGALLAVKAGERTFGHVSRNAYLKMFAG
jgi:hypothetical protein